MDLQIVYQVSKPLLKTNILHTVYLSNENHEHCSRIFSSNERFKKQIFFISSTVTDITNLLYKKLTSGSNIIK